MTVMRHKWLPPARPDYRLSIRACARCGLRKLTHHEGNEHWQTFELTDGTKIASEGLTPACRREQVAV
jgi:hypothetical protein